MELIINIDENSRKQLFDIANNVLDIPLGLESRMITAIVNGTPLPEHYGRLIDADVAAANIEAAQYELSGEYEEGLHEAWEIVNSEDAVPTIIPATKEKSCDDCTNWNEHYGTITCMDCQNRNLWKSNQSTTKEGAK